MAGFALAYLIALAGGMRSVPRIGGSESLVGLALPVIALLLVWGHARSVEDSSRVGVILLCVPPTLLALAGGFVVTSSYFGQPSPRGLAKRVRDLLRGPTPIYWSQIGRVDRFRVLAANYSLPRHGERGLTRDVDRFVLPPEDEVVSESYLFDVADAADEQKPGAVRGLRVLVGAGGSGGLIDEHSTLIVGDRLYVAIGREIVCLSLPSMDLRWRRVFDPEVMIGVRECAGSLFAHGAGVIRRMTPDGDEVWCFAHPVPMVQEAVFVGDAIELRDAEGESITLALSDGARRQA